MKWPTTELDLPSDWSWALISDIANFSRGISWSKTEEAPEGEGTLVVSIPNIKDGWIDYKSKFNHFISKSVPKTKRLHLGDIVFVGSSGSVHNVGRNAHVTQLPCEGAAFASFTFKATPNSALVDTRFFYFLVNSDLVPFSHFCKRAADGKFNFQLRDFTSRHIVPLPPIAEQREISQTLSAVQRAIDAQEQIIQITTELKKALMQKLFTEGLRGEPQKETEIGLVPESWGVVQLVSLLHEPLRNGHSAKATTDDDGIRTLTLTAVTQRDFSMENTKVTCADPHRVRDMWLRSGDIFIERANTADYVGLAALYEGAHDFAIFPDLLIRVRVDHTKIQPKILIEWLLSETCRRYYKKNARSTAGNFPKIDQGTVEKTLIPVPPPEEQKQLEDCFRALDDKMREHASYRSALQDLFNTVVHELMSAKVRVHELDAPIGGLP